MFTYWRKFVDTVREFHLGWLLLAGLSIILFTLGVWEVLERQLFKSRIDAPQSSELIFRGVLVFVLLGAWTVWIVFHFRNQLQNQLSTAANRYRNIVENSADAIITIGIDNHIQSWNKGAERLFGWKAIEIIGEPIGIMIPEKLLQAGELLCLAYGVTTTQEVKNYQTERMNKDGRRIPVNLTESALLTNGEITGRSQIIRDISEMQTIEHQMRQSDRLATVGQLAAGVAHEIGNPLTSIHSLVQLLERRMENPDHIKKLARIQSNIERITKIVHELVDFTRPQATDTQAIHINEVIQSAVGLMSYDNRSQKISIKLDLQENLPRIKASPDKVHQVIVNLLVNAFDALKETGDTIFIATGEDKKSVTITVRDNGAGMDPDVMDKIFEPFFTTKDVGKGTGLGLSVSHGIINSMNGKLSVYSDVGKGAVFLIEIPKEYII
ncbi:MAG: PAS domain S-box protein [Candidatus Marinimicrobia bacterium]|nr:PAS domain S-box protein [Candidatus Neomarinimicrobiota bacterium]MCF7850159.1 PAS domain S-box protein [Candidatus Neomarinimicrobiota bacterium]